MIAGRIETYVHSDSYTENKGGCIIKVICKSDAAANTDEFKEFCKFVAPLCYAHGANIKEGENLHFYPIGERLGMFDEFPQIPQFLSKLEAKLKEKIEITEVRILRL